MKKKSNRFEETVIEQLKDPEFAAEYLNEHLSYQGPKRVELILNALHQVVEARGVNSTAKKPS